ncbi:MAG: mevalonate kinase [Thermoplasmata archaeon HGW-Thermoplasmata-1]|nr:MAG: mevalonate kinase [Thermoplasmata archaeon HGW-Thermoplasmata-1]
MPVEQISAPYGEKGEVADDACFSASASAPGKVILLGEHAVIYGEAAISAAIDMRTRVSASVVGREFTVDGHPLNPYRHTYIKRAVDTLWRDDPVRFITESGVPSASGTGSSAALTVATVAALLKLKGEYSVENVAQKSFEVEYGAQGGASPNDTSVSTHGSGILITGNPKRWVRHGFTEPLWVPRINNREWHVFHLDMPDLTLVVGNSGVKSKTPIQVAKIRRFFEKSGFARDLVVEVGNIVERGLKVLADGDYPALGKLMNRNHEILHTLGVNCPELQSLVDAARSCPGTYGAKITGAGGGGSMLALTENPDEVAAEIAKAGGVPYIIKLSKKGVALE